MLPDGPQEPDLPAGAEEQPGKMRKREIFRKNLCAVAMSPRVCYNE